MRIPLEPTYRDEFLNELGIVVLPDPHMGRGFAAGVPLERRGERESWQWDDFTKALEIPNGCSLHVTIGDLFNKMYVSYDILIAVAEAYLTAANNFPLAEFVILKGNHDSTRNMERRSAFDVFARIVDGIPNIHIVAEQPTILRNCAFVPWSPNREASALIADLPEGLDAAFGHWDIETQGPNHLPAAELARITQKVYTGHEHLPGILRTHGITVVRVGSMQPYAHGEDPSGSIYVTQPLAQVVEALDRDPQTYRMKCLRIVLQTGETPPEKIDCLQLSTISQAEQSAESVDTEAALESFDIEALFENALSEHGVGDEVANALRQRFGSGRETLAVS